MIVYPVTQRGTRVSRVGPSPSRFSGVAGALCYPQNLRPRPNVPATSGRASERQEPTPGPLVRSRPRSVGEHPAAGLRRPPRQDALTTPQRGYLWGTHLAGWPDTARNRHRPHGWAPDRRPAKRRPRTTGTPPEKRGPAMIWIGNTVTAHRKKGHRPQPRWEYRNGVKVIKRWVCTCGATLRG